MTMAGDATSQATTPLAYRVGRGADAGTTADALVAVWQDIDVALRPVIGQRGVVALFNRSVHLTAAAHPWLAPGRQDGAAPLDPAALKALFAQQSVAQAQACGDQLLQTFHHLLVSLIGPSLTERLLRRAWGPPSDGLPLQGDST